MTPGEQHSLGDACRVCMNDHGKYNIFHESLNGGTLIHQLLILITSLEFSENDGLPKEICEQCLIDLKGAVGFKQKCEESDKKIRTELKLINQNNSLTEICCGDSLNNNPIKQEISDRSGLLIIETFPNTSDCAGFILNSNSNKTRDKRRPGRSCKVKIEHISEKIEYNCELCEKTFVSNNELQKHVKKHSALKSFQCRVCHKIFGQNSHLQRHLLIHTGLKPFSCDICNKSFKQKPHLIRHVSVHTGVKPYQCEVCGKNFVTTSDLSKHSIIHTGFRPFQCEMCGKSYNNTSDLNKHLARKHNYDPNRFRCAVCEMRCDTKKALNQHMLVHCDSDKIWTKLKNEKSNKCDIKESSLNSSKNPLRK